MIGLVRRMDRCKRAEKQNFLRQKKFDFQFKDQRNFTVKLGNKGKFGNIMYNPLLWTEIELLSSYGQGFNIKNGKASLFST